MVIRPPNINTHAMIMNATEQERVKKIREKREREEAEREAERQQFVEDTMPLGVSAGDREAERRRMMAARRRGVGGNMLAGGLGLLGNRANLSRQQTFGA